MPRQNKKRACNYAVWTDGSSYEGGHVMGAGWVIRQGGKYLKGVALPLSMKGAGSPTIAEIEAVTAALLSLPRKSRVVIHTDCQAVVDCFQKELHRYNPEAGSRSRQKFNLSIHRLFEAAARHWHVNIIKVGADNDRLQQAHDLARVGAAMNKTHQPR